MVIHRCQESLLQILLRNRLYISGFFLCTLQLHYMGPTFNLAPKEEIACILVWNSKESDVWIYLWMWHLKHHVNRIIVCIINFNDIYYTFIYYQQKSFYLHVENFDVYGLNLFLVAVSALFSLTFLPPDSVVLRAPLFQGSGVMTFPNFCWQLSHTILL